MRCKPAPIILCAIFYALSFAGQVNATADSGGGIIESATGYAATGAATASGYAATGAATASGYAATSAAAVNKDATLAPYFYVEGEGGADDFPLKDTTVTANINGVIADIYVKQTYGNEGGRPINARYVFPASTRASVHGMTLQIGDDLVSAQIKEREEAQAKFTKAKSEGKSAALLEQQRSNVFSMNVANIMPGDIAEIELHYTELLAPCEGVYQFVFPTVVGPRYSSQFSEGATLAGAPQADTLQVGAPQTGGSQTGVPQAGGPQASTLQTGSLQTGSPQAVMLQTGSPQRGSPQAITLQTRSLNAGSPQVVLLQTGAPQTGAPQADAPQADAPQASALQTGAPQADAPQADVPQTGGPQTGVPQAGAFDAIPYLTAGETPPGSYDICVNISAGVPITGLACLSHGVDVAWDGETGARVTLSDPREYAGNRDYILEYKLTGQEIGCGIMLQKGEDENVFMLTIQPPERFEADNVPPREFIFVLDVSGSMSGYPLDAAKALIKSLLSGIRDTDSFNIVLFSGASVLMSTESLPATDANIKYAIDMVDRQNGGGGTELAQALRTAVDIRKMGEDMCRSVVVITDGYISEEKATIDIINANLNDTSFFAFGIGESVNRSLIEGVAKAGMGEAFIVTGEANAYSEAQRFRKYIESPVLTDISVEYEGVGVYDLLNSNPPTLFVQKPITLLGKWRGEPSGSVKITGKSGEGDFLYRFDLSGVEAAEANTALGYLWARTKVDMLMSYGFSSEGEQAPVKDEIINVGLKYSMMTPYTSFVAVIDKVRNTDMAGKDVNQPLPLPRHVSNLAVGYTVGAEPGLVPLAAGLLIPAIAAIAKAKRKARGTPRASCPTPLKMH